MGGLVRTANRGESPRRHGPRAGPSTKTDRFQLTLQQLFQRNGMRDHASAPIVRGGLRNLFRKSVPAGCAANWLKNRTFHCAITGPVFLIAGFVFLLPGMVRFQVSTSWVWPFVLIGVGVAFLLEWRYAKRPTSRP